MHSNTFLFLVNILILLMTKVKSLYPRESVTREVKKLDGVWNFKICHQYDQEIGFRERWYSLSLATTGDVIPMPVPSSFNDITQNKTIRDYLGWSWYETNFYAPQRWRENFRVLLRFGSAHYVTFVYLNGQHIMTHTGGHLPFEADVTKFLKFSEANRITVALNNTLSQTTIPQGSKTFKTAKDGPYPSGYYIQSTNFDFFNYAGIHRSVVLYAMPQLFIKDLDIVPRIENKTGIIKFDVTIQSVLSSLNEGVKCLVSVLNKEQKLVVISKVCNGEITIRNAKLWWPNTMSTDPGYLYTLKVNVSSENITDIYIQPFGIRTVEIKKNKFLINGKPFYFMGFGKHEDANIRGKGLDLPLIIKDFNLIKWIGANSFRTSHYPYSEELMDQADAQGIAVIEETPAVGLKNFNNILLQQHMSIIKELIARDKNRPSVVAWSVANEPSSSNPDADKYFSQIVAYTKSLDGTRPVSAALNADFETDKAGKYLDFLMINHYFSWYDNVGSTEIILPLLVNYITTAYKTYKKPIMMSEYGADTIPGLHMDPSFIFTEDYQVEMMINHHKAFDVLKQKGFFIGEHIWNFADFLTLQQLTRVVGNKKGIFTRERQPKAAAHLLRCRYHKLVNRKPSGSAPYCSSVNDTNPYVSSIQCLKS